MVKDTCTVQAMVTILSWMADVRTSFFIVRIPGREQERINITFCWVKQHVSSSPLFEAEVACCLPTCAQGSSFPVMENALSGIFWVFLVSPWCLVHMGSPSLAGLPVVYKAWVSSVCFLLDTPLGEVRWGHYLCNLLGETA